MLYETTDRSTLACGVAAYEQEDDPLALGLHPTLELEKLDLEGLQLLSVDLARQSRGVGVTAAGQRLKPDLLGQEGIVDIETRQLFAWADLLEHTVFAIYLSPLAKRIQWTNIATQ
jgi:hypothetical protein